MVGENRSPFFCFPVLCSATANCEAAQCTKQHTLFLLKAILGTLEQTQTKCSPRDPAEQHSKNRVEATLLHRRQTETRIEGTQKEFQPGKLWPHTADAVSLLSESARSRSLSVSSLLLFFLPLGTGSFSFFCFFFRLSIPMSHQGHST